MTTFRVDDTFGNLISYSDGWMNFGAVQEFHSTTHSTTTSGSTATFTFNGTQVQVFGTVHTIENPDPGPTLSSYSIDGGAATPYTAPDTTVTLYSTLFFTSPTLSNGQHVLTITFNGGREYYIDYIQYSGLLQASTTTTTSATSASSFPSTSATTTSTPSPTVSGRSSTVQASTTTTSSTSAPSFTSPSPIMLTSPSNITLTSPSTIITVTTTPSPTISGKSSTNTPVLAGAVVGAFFGVLILALLYFLYSRRKKRPPKLEAFTTTPFSASGLHTSSLQPAFTQVPPIRRSSADSSNTPGLSMGAMTSDRSDSHSPPPAYSKRREAFGS